MASGRRSFSFPSLPFLPRSQGGDVEKNTAVCCTCSRFMSQLKNPKFKQLQSFKVGSQKTCPNLATEGAIIFIIQVRKQICSLLSRKQLSLSSKSVCNTDVLKRQSRTKLIQNCRNIMEKSSKNQEKGNHQKKNYKVSTIPKQIQTK